MKRLDSLLTAILVTLLLFHTPETVNMLIGVTAWWLAERILDYIDRRRTAKWAKVVKDDPEK
jgi:hypothetical protein